MKDVEDLDFFKATAVHDPRVGFYQYDTNGSVGNVFLRISLSSSEFSVDLQNISEVFSIAIIGDDVDQCIRSVDRILGLILTEEISVISKQILCLSLHKVKFGHTDELRIWTAFNRCAPAHGTVTYQAWLPK